MKYFRFFTNVTPTRVEVNPKILLTESFLFCAQDGMNSFGLFIQNETAPCWVGGWLGE